jgi:signal transduction histidine kinase
VRPRIFEPFFTTRPDGTGMGLPTVRKVIERMGGAVALESTGPEGTVFRLELRLATG